MAHKTITPLDGLQEVTVTQAARVLGLSAHQVRRLCEEGHLTRTAQGTVRWSDCMLFIKTCIHFYRDNRKKPIQSASERKAHAQANLYEIRERQLNQELVDKTRAENQYQAGLAAARLSLLQLPRAIEPHLPRRQRAAASAKVLAEVERALIMAAETAAAEAAAEADGEQ